MRRQETTIGWRWWLWGGLLGVILGVGGCGGNGTDGTVTAQTLPPQTAQVAPGVFSYSPGNGYISMFVVAEDAGVIAVESVNTAHAMGLLEAIRGVTDLPVRYLVHSHNHWDHASGGQVFKDAGAQTVAHADAAAWMAAHPGPEMVAPDMAWPEARHDLTVGNTTMELHHFGASHGRGMTVARLPETQVAYIADLVSPRRVGFTILPDFNLLAWERTLDAILMLDFQMAVYSHSGLPDPLAGGPRLHIEETRQYIRDMRAAVQGELMQGTPALQVPGIVQLPQYETWGGYDAFRELNAWRFLMDELLGPY